ncbi:hypothetical protein SAPIO_CDS7034 [Scedosporium apiospermum]|uniref:Phosphatidylglycerol/phosphatidylinositol transfer protein n=1 Tax=Pseudallescheria apiosperma TaxID=563466 RepID=A0A084G0Z4_PSEDA|nr:uncharacterized protein SAPIO_CDS7034 [Scedosporium apiospermum]KEZ41006.1 hypothetical protein SAPIO_CDS7034 [Scedosporium apiospermum]
MKFSAVIAVLSATLAPATAFFSSPSKIRGDDTSVPGNSPLEYCDPEHDNDVLTIKSVDLVPNPPLAGEELVIKAVGHASKDIEEGAYVLLTVKYGLIKLISTTADLCEQIKNVDLECPIKEGQLSITKSVDLPAEIPPGKYTVLADVYTKDDEPITCLQATVVFARGERFLNFEL